MLRRIAGLSLLVVLPVFTCGCLALLAGAAGGAGTSVWLSGKLVQEVDSSFEETVGAVESGLESLSLDVAKMTKKDDVAQIKSNYTDGKTIWVDVRPVTSSSSKIEVRVGAIGDEEAAREVLDSILKYL